MDESRADQQIGYILRSYPRLSQTFILNEVLGLENLGFKLRIFALSPSGERLVQPMHEQVQARVTYLDRPARQKQGTRAHARLLSSQPAGYLGCLGYLASRPWINHGYSSTTRAEAFNQAVFMVSQIQVEGHRTRRGFGRLHAHFAHDPALVALIAHKLTGTAYSFTAHARDLYQLDTTALVERARLAETIITCCQANLDYLRKTLSPDQHHKIHLVHHGVNLEIFQKPTANDANTRIPLLLSAGRLVEKKGFHDLIAALQAIHERGERFHCHIYGDGPLKVELQNQINQAGLQEKVELKGAFTQRELAEALSQASIFVLTPSVTANGDRDGLPNVLVEAMAGGVPVISTYVGGIPDLVEPGKNGLLVAPGNVPEIRDAVLYLLEDKGARRKMGKQARDTAALKFDGRAAALRLAGLFQAEAG